MNRSKVIEANLHNDNFKKYPIEELHYSKKEQMKSVCFSISEEGLAKLKDYKIEKKVTPSVMIDAIVRRELKSILKIMECCEHVIEGKTSQNNYFVSINKVDAISGLTKNIKKAIGQYSEVINYKEEYFVIMPYSILFKYLSGGNLNACP